MVTHITRARTLASSDRLVEFFFIRNSPSFHFFPSSPGRNFNLYKQFPLFIPYKVCPLSGKWEGWGGSPRPNLSQIMLKTRVSVKVLRFLSSYKMGAEIEQAVFSCISVCLSHFAPSHYVCQYEYVYFTNIVTICQLLLVRHILHYWCIFSALLPNTSSDSIHFPSVPCIFVMIVFDERTLSPISGSIA